MNEQGAMVKEYQSRGLWLAAVVVLIVACIGILAVAGVMVPDTIQGSGTILAEHRPVSHFERISLGDLGTVIITQGDEVALIVETDDNLLPYVETRVQGGTLVLGLSKRVKGRVLLPSEGITYHLRVRQIDGLEAADSGRIQAPTLDVGHLEILAYDDGSIEVGSLMAEMLQVSVEDSGNVRLAGQVGGQEVKVHDSGHYLAGRLESRTATIAASDSAEATLWATEALDVTATDSAHVHYHGNPRRSQRLADDGSLVGQGGP